MSLGSYLEALTNAPSLEVLWDMHCRKMASYGFDRLLYGYTRYRNGASLGDPEDFVVLTNHPTSYAETFVAQGLYFHGPMVRWALDNEGACSWRVVADMVRTGNMTASEARVIQFNKAHGVNAGYTIGFKSVSPRAKGGIALTAAVAMDQDQVDAIWERHGHDILVMNNVAHLKILTLPYTAPGRSLTRRQREALGWVGDGKTTQDIAVLMGLTPATVEKHLRLAREALNVETTAQAVLKAALQNQMFVLDV
jgi:LuxR family transcriptional regulator